MAAAASKANQRQSRKRAGYYAAQYDKTPINKIIRVARHIARYGDKRALSRLKQAPAIDKHRAYQKCKGTIMQPTHAGMVILSAS